MIYHISWIHTVWLISNIYLAFGVSCIILDNYRTVTRCDRSIRSGSAIYADFGKIGRLCRCIVTSSFNGELYVTSHKTTNVLCKNRVTVNKTVIFNCNNGGFKEYNVQISKSRIPTTYFWEVLSMLWIHHIQ